MLNEQIVLTRTFPIKVGEIWFCDQLSAAMLEAKNRGLDIVHFRETATVYDMQSGVNSIAFNNGDVSLDCESQKIFANCDPSFRNEVRRAIKENISIEFASSENLHISDDIFNSYYNFHRNKNLHPIPKKLLKKYIDANLILSASAFWNNTPIRSHLYISVNSKMLLIGSFPRESSSEIRPNLAGWANRLLHWKAIEHGVENGYTTYSLGGIGNPGSKNNEQIIKFKLEMCPSAVTRFNFSIPLSLSGRFIHKIRDIKKYITKSHQ